MKFIDVVRLVLVFGISLVTGSLSYAGTQKDVSDAIGKLRNTVSNQANVSVNRVTGYAGFVRLEPGSFVGGAEARLTSRQKTRKFLDDHGPAFGLLNHANELRFKNQLSDVYGHKHVRYRQVHRGIPVFGAELSGHFDGSGQLIAVSSSTFEIDLPDITATLSTGDASGIAIDHVKRGLKNHAPALKLLSVNQELLIYRTGLLRGVEGRDHLAYRVEIASEHPAIREFVFVDARQGKVIDQITGVYHALDRKVSETNINNIRWEDSTGDPDPIPPGWTGGSSQQILDWQNEIDGARETYNLFASMTAGSWLSYGGNDETMRTVNDASNLQCPNAMWTGSSTIYCPNVTSDDVVAHEWGHAYTEYTADLVYQWQSGALSESYSDIWGEVVDLLNGRGTDLHDELRSDGGCSKYYSPSGQDDSYRWLIGEDSTAFIRPLRDMWSPNCAGHPASVTDSDYWCSSGDNGGVHKNSGVPNHAFALLVDGGDFNGYVINGIGLTKAAHIYWNSLQMMTPVSNFVSQADALEASCAGLAGIDLPALSTGSANAGLSGEQITTGDCDAVAAAISAVELRAVPVQCGFEEILETDPPPRCEGKGELSSISLTDWETGQASWIAGTREVANPATFITADWAVVTGLPDVRPGSAAFVADLVAGDCGADDQTGVLTLISPEITIPPNVVTPRISIDHWMASEYQWDGGNLKISVDGGPFVLLPPSSFEVGEYNGLVIVSNGSDTNTNPLAGEAAFTGTNAGGLSGSWGQSQINLSGFATAGNSIRLSFEFGLDGCNGVIGWYVDEVEVHGCTAEMIEPGCGDGIIGEAEQCDDGNNAAGDGCSNNCQVEPGWLCSSAPSVCEDNRPPLIFADGLEG